MLGFDDESGDTHGDESSDGSYLLERPSEDTLLSPFWLLYYRDGF